MTEPSLHAFVAAFRLLLEELAMSGMPSITLRGIQQRIHTEMSDGDREALAVLIVAVAEELASSLQLGTIWSGWHLFDAADILYASDEDIEEAVACVLIGSGGAPASVVRAYG